jgi:hypothetical protein
MTISLYQFGQRTAIGLVGGRKRGSPVGRRTDSEARPSQAALALVVSTKIAIMCE